MPHAPVAFSGGCLCRGVRFRGTGLREIVYCHCSQCRRGHGAAAAYAATARASLCFDALATLRWYEASTRARRGFCGHCGCSLLWDAFGAPDVCIAAAAIDDDSALRAARHVYCADRAPWEAIGTGLACFDGSMQAPVRERP